MTVDELYDLAEERGYVVDWRLLTVSDGFTMRLPMDRYAIVIDPSKVPSEAEHKTKLGHGLGHAETGSIYNPYTPFDIVQQHENRADKWEVLHLVPREDLKSAMANGCREVWELAEKFGVTEELIKKAFVWYKYGTMDYKNYFPEAS